MQTAFVLVSGRCSPSLQSAFSVCKHPNMGWKQSQEHANAWHTCTLWYSVRRAPEVNDQWINFQLEKFRHSTKSDVCKPKVGAKKEEEEKKWTQKMWQTFEKEKKQAKTTQQWTRKVVEFVCKEIETRLSAQKPTKQSEKLLKSTAATCSVCTFSIQPLGVTAFASTFVRMMFKAVDRRNVNIANGGEKWGNEIWFGCDLIFGGWIAFVVRWLSVFLFEFVISWQRRLRNISIGLSFELEQRLAINHIGFQCFIRLVCAFFSCFLPHICRNEFLCHLSTVCIHDSTISQPDTDAIIYFWAKQPKIRAQRVTLIRQS